MKSHVKRDILMMHIKKSLTTWKFINRYITFLKALHYFPLVAFFKLNKQSLPTVICSYLEQLIHDASSKEK